MVTKHERCVVDDAIDTVSDAVLIIAASQRSSCGIAHYERHDVTTPVINRAISGVIGIWFKNCSLKSNISP